MNPLKGITMKKRYFDGRKCENLQSLEVTWQLELEKNGDENHSYLSSWVGVLCRLESIDSLQKSFII